MSANVIDMPGTSAITCQSQQVPADTTTQQLADALHVHLRTVQRWARDGSIKPAWTTPGGHPRWDVADVRRQLGMPPE